MDDRSDDVLGNFFTSSGRLHTLPAKRAKRLVVLDHMVQSFEPGETYTEKDVNKILAGFHDDYATLRRALVDEEFLSRDNNLYWRSGGSFDV